MSDQTPQHDPLADAFQSFRTNPGLHAPGLDAVHRTVRTRRRTRIATVSAAVVLAVGGGGASLATVASQPDEVMPTPSPSSSQSVNPTPTQSPGPGDIRTIDWLNATVTLPRRSDDCPGGKITFSNGRAEVPDSAANLGKYSYTIASTAGAPPIYGDINQDGREDAVLSVLCGTVGLRSGVIAVTASGSELTVLGWIVGGRHDQEYVKPVSIAGDGTITFHSTGPRSDITETFRWDGNSFVRTGQYELDSARWSEETLEVPSIGSCPGGVLTFEKGRAEKDGHTYAMGLGRPPAYGNLVDDARVEAILGVSCDDGDRVVFAVRWDGDDIVLLARIMDFPASWKFEWLEVTGKDVTVDLINGEQKQQHTFRWDGEKFVPTS